MSSVEARACGPDELLAAEADRGSQLITVWFVANGTERGGGRCGRRRDALLRRRGVLGESFQVDRGAAERELQVEGGGAAATDAAEPVMVLQLGDHALGVRHPQPVCPDAGLAFRACAGREREPLRVRARRATVARQHRLLRRDVGDDPPLGRVFPDALGGEALVGADARELWQQETDAVEQRSERVAFVTLRTLGETAGDTAPLRINRDLAAMNEVRPLPRLALQPRVRIAARDRGRVRRLPFRRRARARLGQSQLRRLARGLVSGSWLRLGLGGARLEAREIGRASCRGRGWVSW